MDRPFYGEYAWAYDLIVANNMPARCDFIIELLQKLKISVGARILDAGCGPGTYSIELARRGFEVEGMDLSPHLIEEARKQAASSQSTVSFSTGDITALSTTTPFDAVLCRGVLNDLLDDVDRQRAFASFAGVLRLGGLLIFDVREWAASVERKTREPITETTVETELGALTFRSETSLDHERKRLLITERHTLKGDSHETVSDYQFEMRAWTKEEAESLLQQAGFSVRQVLGDYGFGAPVGSSDRLVYVAARID